MPKFGPATQNILPKEGWVLILRKYVNSHEIRDFSPFWLIICIITAKRGGEGWPVEIFLRERLVQMSLQSWHANMCVCVWGESLRWGWRRTESCDFEGMFRLATFGRHEVCSWEIPRRESKWKAKGSPIFLALWKGGAEKWHESQARKFWRRVCARQS